MPRPYPNPLLISAATLAMAASPAPAADQNQSRTFTSADGRKIKATLLGVAEGKAKLKLASGRAANIHVARFSDTDHEGKVARKRGLNPDSCNGSDRRSRFLISVREITFRATKRNVISGIR